jgi:lysyl-tRNA synthetase, class II
MDAFQGGQHGPAGVGIGGHLRPELIEARRAKLARLRELGVNPYPYSYQRTHTVDQLLQGFDDRAEDEQVALCGRLMALRPMGKATFAGLQDPGGRIQLFFRKDEIGDRAQEILSLLDLGDLIGVRGVPMRTKTGEATVRVSELVVLCKSLSPLPVVKEKDGQVFDAWEDVEARQRQRYLDLLLNPETRQIFEVRAKTIRGLRAFLDERGFLEVETPMLQAVYGGAMARPFTTFHNVLAQRLYLRISEELPLKKLLVGGIERVYEIGRVFRNEGVDRTHNPEFTLLEFYWAWADYSEAMDLVETMCREVALSAAGGLDLDWRGQRIDLAAPFARRPMVQLVAEKTGLDVLSDPEDRLRSRLRERGVEVPAYAGRGHLIEALFDDAVQPELIQPTFVTDHPREISPLAKEHRDRPEFLVERFELFIGGHEFANAFSELNDPADQRRRFEDQAVLKTLGDDEAQVLDEDFLAALEHGMPPAAGVGLGVDRLVMLLSGAAGIREVLLFPHLRSEEGRSLGHPDAAPDRPAAGGPEELAR